MAAELSANSTEEQVWNAIVLLAGCPFQTKKGLSFSYTIKGNEIFVSRKEKSITRATVKVAYQRAAALGGVVSGPKQLGVFGASYLYPVFVRLGVISETSEKGAADGACEMLDSEILP